MLLRNGKFSIAENLAKEALSIHFATGRLWATLVQIKHAQGKSEDCYQTFINAIWEIPKSGEVWCEGARFLMSPASHMFDLKNAEKFLNFAIYFTPQYGDSFLEMMRLLIIKGEEDRLPELKRQCIHSEPNYGLMWFYFKEQGSDSSLDIWNRAEDLIRKELSGSETNLSLYDQRALQDAPISDASKFWTGCLEMNTLYSSGKLQLPSDQSGVSRYERWRNIYGFE